MEDVITVMDEKSREVSKGAAAASKELRHYDSVDAVSTIGGIRQPSPQQDQNGPKLTTTDDEKKAPKLGFDSISCYGRPSNDGEVEGMRSVKSFEAPREGRVGIRRNQSFENAGARSRASLLGEVRIERMVEVVLEDGDGGKVGGSGEDLTFR